MTAIPKAERIDNRRRLLLDAAAAVFAQKGFHAATMRDIATAAGMLPGSIYYHFPSKDDLLLAVYEEGVKRIADHVDTAVARHRDPWQRLEQAARAHLEMLLDRSDHALVLVRVLPRDANAAEDRLIALRDAYEQRFRKLVADLPLAAGADRSKFRLLLLGALNACPIWRRPDGDGPGRIAADFVALLRAGHGTSGAGT
jgi:AcrR family transcriptional regulator